MNRDEFKIALLDRQPIVLSFLSAFADTDSDYLLVGAVDVNEGSGSVRNRSFSQVAAVLENNKAAVIGDYPTVTSTDLVAGLVRDVTNDSST